MPSGTSPLPADDPDLRSLTLDELELRWTEAASRTAISAESMTGADRKAQALGIPGEQLMEHAGTAVAAAARALLQHNAREGRSILILAGPGNNGGDGFVAARRLAEWGHPVIAVLVAAEERPRTRDAAHNWKRLDGIDGVTLIHVPVARDLAILEQGIEKAGIIVDALLGTGVQGRLREPVRSAVEMIRRARDAGTPVLAVDTPTAVDLTSGDPSDPVVRADLTITFHRPKLGLRARVGKAYAGRVLVAPIGIPQEADRG
ncbi:MAG: NAD(P)H-hydrate epimerase [Chloroflexi bacterium]|nr:NAD(P)H-hydrate epimerase [Chloroflexota bacterium]